MAPGVPRAALRQEAAAGDGDFDGDELRRRLLAAAPVTERHTRLLQRVAADLDGVRERWGELAAPLEE